VAPKLGLLGYYTISHTSNPEGWIRVLAGSGSAVDKKSKIGYSDHLLAVGVDRKK
jgi:hypothetical protein